MKEKYPRKFHERVVTMTLALKCEDELEGSGLVDCFVAKRNFILFVACFVTQVSAMRSGPQKKNICLY